MYKESDLTGTGNQKIKENELQKVELKRMTRILGTIAFLIPLDSKATE